MVSVRRYRKPVSGWGGEVTGLPGPRIIDRAGKRVDRGRLVCFVLAGEGKMPGLKLP